MPLFYKETTETQRGGLAQCHLATYSRCRTWDCVSVTPLSLPAGEVGGATCSTPISGNRREWPLLRPSHLPQVFLRASPGRMHRPPSPPRPPQNQPRKPPRLSPRQLKSFGDCARLWGGLRVGAAQRKGVGRNKAFLHGDSLFSPQLLKIGGFMLQAQKGKEGDAWLGGRKVTCGHPWLGEGERCTCPAPRDLCTSRASEGTPSCYIQGCTTHLQVALPL